MMMVVRLLRIHHWVKNCFILMPVFFAAKLTQPGMMQQVLLAFFGFSLVASAVYILNDIADIEQDRIHPRKKERPIAKGQIPKNGAALVMVLCLICGLSVVALSGWTALMITGGYFIVNILYSWWLKHIAIIDVSLIGVGFLLRIYLGGAATGVSVSNWLTVLTFILALILGFAKRRGEFLIASQQPGFRKSLEGYNLTFLNAVITVCSTVAIVAYLMYCFSPEVTQRIGSEHIYFTALFVILGILRYLQLALVEERTESPTRLLLEDPFLQIVLLVWIGAFAYLLY